MSMLYQYVKLRSMHILDVIPLIALPRTQPGTASYYHSAPVAKGTVVQVLYNNRKIKAVVVESVPLASRKLQFKKQASFTLKAITKILKETVTEAQIQKAKKLSDYYFAPLGICMRAIILHPEATNWKRYIAPGIVRATESLSEYFPDLSSTAHIKIVDMRKEIRDANYSIFSRHHKEALQVAHEEKKQLIIFIPRKGYANFLLCKDCGTGIKCPNPDVLLGSGPRPERRGCSVSLVVYFENGKEYLKCHRCNFQMPIPKQCPSCKSYNLKPYGVGIDKVESELIKFFKYQNLSVPKIAQLSSESKKMPTNWDILLATQSIFSHKIHVQFLAIMNADALIQIPDYSAEEKLLKQTLLLASFADQTYIQTYNPDDPALVAAASGKVKEFWDSELTSRKEYGYPPFVRLVKLTYHHRDSFTAKRVAQNIKEMLEKKLDTNYLILATISPPYSALISRERGLYVWHLLLKIPLETIHSSLRTFLQNLPQEWTIDVDPVNIV